MNHWSNNIIKILSDYKEICITRKWLHETESRKYRTKNQYLNLISIFFTSITATSSTVTTSIQMTNNMYSQISDIISPIVLYITAVINLLQHFYNFEKIAEQHYTFSLRYNTLQNNIHRMLALDEIDRQDSHDYFKWVTTEYDNLTSNMPSISTNTINEYDKKFKTIFNDNPIKIESDNKMSINAFNISSPFQPNEINISSLNSNEMDSKRLKYDLERYALNCYNN